MHFLYLSGLASQDALTDAQERNPKFRGYAVQKFNRLVAEGLARNGQHVKALSTFYMPEIGHYYYRHHETSNDVHYHYIASPNNHPLRHMWLVVYCFFYVLFWGLFNKKDKALIADVLNISACMGAVVAARLIGLRRVGIMTDMPGLMVNRSNSHENRITGRASFIARMNKSFLAHFTHYVFLTEKMNDAVNVNSRPYIVMEGLVDADMQVPKAKEKTDKRIVLYAGGLHERYGLKMLVEGFLQADVPGTELWIYGSGPFADSLSEYSKRDSRIVYKGIRPNNEVVEAELRATLLVNPRPTHEEFTQYSFPSKNMEYMVSGTPLLTTQLPGMPEEYYPYVYLFDEGETTNGYAMVLRRVLSLPNEELIIKGKNARKWVLDQKNHVGQTARIIKLLSQK